MLVFVISVSYYLQVNTNFNSDNLLKLLNKTQTNI